MTKAIAAFRLGAYALGEFAYGVSRVGAGTAPTERVDSTRKIVEGHGGKIWAESEPGRGTTFLITLPGQDGGRA